MGDQFDEVVKALANAKEPMCVTAAAGCGKTEAIVRAVAMAEGKQLILTHTNAGVAALRSRLRKCSVPESKYRVDTIASWLLKYASAYPVMSGLTNPHPQDNEWEKVYPAAETLFNRPFIRDVFLASYTGIFVDEYQDCTQQQHRIIWKMVEYLPVKVLGDPLQGIFRFNNNVPVDWSEDVVKYFVALPDLTEPYRWARTNSGLGKQLAQIRGKLLADGQIDLSVYSEIKWHLWSEQTEANICCTTNSNRTGSIAGIHQWPSDAHKTARKIGGRCISLLKRWTVKT